MEKENGPEQLNFGNEIRKIDKNILSDKQKQVINSFLGCENADSETTDDEVAKARSTLRKLGEETFEGGNNPLYGAKSTTELQKIVRKIFDLNTDELI